MDPCQRGGGHRSIDPATRPGRRVSQSSHCTRGASDDDDLPNQPMAGLVGERATATFERGVLTLHIPKADEIKPKQVRISAATTSATPEPELVGAGSRR